MGGSPSTVVISHDGPVTIITIDRPHVRNAIDRTTADALADAFRNFDEDDQASVAILHGNGGHFCAGADLHAIAAGEPNRFAPDGDAPLGVTRMRLTKPVIAAIDGHAVAGGLELAVWADLRVASADAILGVFCRRWGVPLIDGGTVRLPRLIGMSHALDLVLTGRPVTADEALRMGLVNRVTPTESALPSAVTLAHQISAFPQTCLRHDRLSVLEQNGIDERTALRNEYLHGVSSVATDAVAGAQRFASGAGRHGEFTD